MNDQESALERSRRLCEEAKRLSLIEWFESYLGREVKIKNGRGRSTWCPECGESKSGNEKCFITDDITYGCFTCGGSGDIIKAEMETYGGNATQAAMRLLGLSADEATRGPLRARHEESEEKRREKQLAEERKYAARREVCKIICKSSKDLRDDAVIEYLVENRKLPYHIVETAMVKGIVRTLPSKASLASAFIRSVVPEELLLAGELWNKESKYPWIAWRPLWFFFPGAVSAELRIITEPRMVKDKKDPTKTKQEPKSIRIAPTNAPYFWAGSNPSGCASVEGVIDLLSMVALDYQGDIMGVPGTQTWEIEWFIQMQQYRKTRSFDLMFDNDIKPDGSNPGQEGAAKLGQALTSVNLPWRNITPPAGDVNDYWKEKCKKL